MTIHAMFIVYVSCLPLHADIGNCTSNSVNICNNFCSVSILTKVFMPRKIPCSIIVMCNNKSIHYYHYTNKVATISLFFIDFLLILQSLQQC